MSAQERRFERRHAKPEFDWTGWRQDENVSMTIRNPRAKPDLRAKERRYFGRHPEVLNRQLSEEFMALVRNDAERSMQQAHGRMIGGMLVQPSIVVYPQDFDDLVRYQYQTSVGTFTQETLVNAMENVKRYGYGGAMRTSLRALVGEP